MTTRITYLTIGILLRLLINDSLGNCTHIVLDEVHERSLDSDFALGLVRKLLEKKNGLKVVIMSATVDSEKFSDYFTTASTTVSTIKIPGRTFPVTIHGLGDCERISSSSMIKIPTSPGPSPGSSSGPRMSPRVSHRIDENFVINLCTALVKQRNGAILVFLPGKMEIESLKRR